MRNNKSMFLRVFLTLLGVLGVVLIAGVCVYMLWEKAPEVVDEVPPSIVSQGVPVTDQPAATEQVDPDAPTPLSGRKDGVYTVLLVGNDDGHGNTDTILVGRIDTVNHKIDFVSIPRDTYVDINWNIRKVNAVYSGTINMGGDGIDGLKEQVKNLTGFYVDCYAMVDLNVFIETVDAIGGVYFDVPQPMYYEDVGQDLYINLQPGYQLLNGYQAMGVVRYRAGYGNGDLGRIEMQHAFLKEVASQMISLGNIPNISTVLKILSENLNTDLSSANIAYFIRQALMCKSEDINFYTLPNTPWTVYDLSYTFVDIQPWIEMVNDKLNPYNEQVTEDNLDIVYISNGGFKGTQGIRGEWYLYATPESETPEAETPEQAPSEQDTPVDPPEEGGASVVVSG